MEVFVGSLICFVTKLRWFFFSFFSAQTSILSQFSSIPQLNTRKVHPVIYAPKPVREDCVCDPFSFTPAMQAASLCLQRILSPFPENEVGYVRRLLWLKLIPAQ